MRAEVILLLSVFMCTGLKIFAYHVPDPASYAYSNGTCKKYYWKCQDGPCIDELRKCDSVEDCIDGSDEEACDTYCDLDTHYQCLSGECIEREMVCNDANNCFTEDDEENCESDKTKPCPKNYFRCENGRCIPQNWVCDGRSDCKGGADEKNCSKSCPRGYSPCNSSECIPLTLVCDGSEDCSEGEDEKGCSTKSRAMCSTERGLYLCKDKSKCLKSEWVCDSSPHCDDGSDENEDCGTHCNGLPRPCSHECFRTPDGPRCTCKPGLKLSRDNATCVDINECEMEKQVCDHFCKNNVESFECSCGDGYRLLGDEATCRIEEPALLLFSVGNNVEAKLLDGSSSWIVSKGSKEAFGVALDPITENVYWIENRERVLFKHLYDDEDPKVFIHQGLELPENLVIDWFGRNIYVADYKRNQILACNLESEDCVPILKNLERPRALQLDLHNRYLYWTAIKSHTIERAGLDGSQRKTVISEDIVWPNGLAIDHPASRIYWADARLNKIDSCNLDGKQRKSLPHEDADHAYSLAVWQDRIFWTEWQKAEDLHMEIYSCRKRDGKLWKSEYKDEKRAVNNIAIYHKSMFKNSVNPCRRSFEKKCSHLCLLSPVDRRGYVCSCPIEMTLDEHGHTCHENESKIPLVAVQSKLYGVPLRNYGASNPQLRKYARLDLGVVADMDYNPHKDIVYFADPRNELISSVNLSNRKVERLIENIKRPISVAIDWLRDNLYWINGFHHSVEVSRSSGMYRQTVIKKFQNPTDLALDVINGYLFASDASIAPSIMKCELNGTGCTTLAFEGIKYPSSIFLDPTVEPKMLYWTDSEKNTIEAIGVDGSNQHVVFKDLKHPTKVHVDAEHILWSEMRSTFLYVAEKETNGSVKKINMELENIPAGEWYLTLTMVGGPKTIATINPCFRTQKCHQLCFSKTESEQVCSCAHGLELTEDGSTCISEKCPFNEVQCVNKACIPESYWCDGTADCEDHSDESNCTFVKPCTEREFQCNDGQCIHQEYRCDGMNDCADSSDEDDSCVKGCTHSGEWMCESGECIPLDWRCNGKKNCQDDSDEMNCSEVVCPTDRQKCDDGHCIPHAWFCDGQKDCEDGTDEQGCPCKLGEYTCKDGICLDEEKLCSGILSCGEEELNITCSPNSTFSQYISMQHCPVNFIPCNASSSEVQCIPFEAWCNGTVECIKQEDELNCYTPCKEHEARCMDNSCIPKSWVCDGHPDCLDESDEKNCEKPSVEVTTEKSGCSDSEFECYDRTCIHKRKVCDETPDCPGGEDEYGECDKCSQSNGGCEQVCDSNPYSVICSCKDGFTLSTNGHSCDDIDECEDMEICDHDCVNMKGKFACTCRTNYTIEENGVTCKRIDGSQWSITTVNNKSLINLNTNLEAIGTRSLLPGSLHAENTELIFDPVEKGMLVVDVKSGTIHRRGQFANSAHSWTSDKTNVTDIMATSLDYINRNFYLAKANIFKRKNISEILSTTVKVYNMRSKTTSGTLFDESKIIAAMQLSLEYRNMFTCENDEIGGNIVARNLDGSDRRVLAYKKVMKCQSLAVDSIKRRIFWVDSILSSIESIDFLGHARRRYPSQKILAPKGLSLLDRHLVWFNTNQNVLMKCSLRKPEECSEVSYNGHVKILSISPAYNMDIPSACENSHCPEICVQSTRSIPHCMCKDGSFYDDGKCYAVSYPKKDKISGNCEVNPCVAGTCEYISSEFVHCRCPEGFQGRYCEISAAESPNDRSLQVIITIVVFFILMGIIFVFVFCYKRKPGKFLNRYRFRFHPSFVLMRDESSSEPSTPPVIRYNTATNTNAERLSYENSNDSAIVIDHGNPNIDPLQDVSLSSPLTVDPPAQTPRSTLVTPRIQPRKYSPFHP